MNRHSLSLPLVLGAAGVLHAQSLPVANPSFESPAVPNGFPAITAIDSWQKPPPPPPGFGITAEQWDQLAGIFPNPPAGQPRHVENLDGNQVAFVFPVPGMSLTQTTGSTYTPGLTYSLQVALRGGGSLTPGTSFRIGLYYEDGGNRVTVASTPIQASEAFVTTSQLLEFSATTPLVTAGDAWAGRNIGIELAPLTQNGAPGIAYWELDNVRLAAVPEPAAWALGGLGAAVLVLASRRRDGR